MPAYFVNILLASAHRCTIYPEFCTSEHGARLRRQRAAKAAHKAIRAKGQKPCQAAQEARKRKIAEKKAREAGQTQVELRCGSANTDGI